YRRVDAWSAVSRHAGEVTRRLFRLSSGPDAVLYNPVLLPDSVPASDARIPGRVIFTGTLTAKKGIVSLIDAWPTVVGRNAGATLDVYGKDQSMNGASSMQGYLLARLPEHLRPTVRFHGHQDHAQVMSALGRAQVAVFPSYTETFGLCAAEALASGCATVYTKLSCGPEIVRDGVDGLLADPDQPEEIAGAIGSILG